MKLLFRNWLIIIFLSIASEALAQGNFNISGVVNDEKGIPIKGATVFISGTLRITASDDNGKFIFSEMNPGNFQLTVKMLGYFPYTSNILLKEKSINVTISLAVKSLVLKEVIIGPNSQWEKNYKIFKQNFLGTSKNAESCTILNPEILNFSTTKTTLNASSDDFLIIENHNLGYRIKFLLKVFTYNNFTKITAYDGATSFENLERNENMQSRWVKNRFTAYQGSLMHFLRSVYWNTAIKEGFLTHQLFCRQRGTNTLPMDPRLFSFKNHVNIIDTSFVSFVFSSIYVKYDPKMAPDSLAQYTHPLIIGVQLPEEESVLKLYLDEAIIDRTGSYGDYRSFLIQGYWSRKRVGDQLPFEYQPPSQ